VTWSRFYFRVVAIIFLASGLVATVFSDQYVSLLGADASVGGRLWGRGFGAASLALGAMFWMMDSVAHRRERRIAAIGATVAFGVTGLTDVVSVATGDLPIYGWGFVAFNAVMVVLALILVRDDAGGALDRQGVS
jgi:hypothetical protein